LPVKTEFSGPAGGPLVVEVEEVRNAAAESLRQKLHEASLLTSAPNWAQGAFPLAPVRLVPISY